MQETHTNTNKPPHFDFFSSASRILYLQLPCCFYFSHLYTAEHTQREIFRVFSLPPVCIDQRGSEMSRIHRRSHFLRCTTAGGVAHFIANRKHPHPKFERCRRLLCILSLVKRLNAANCCCPNAEWRGPYSSVTNIFSPLAFFMLDVFCSVKFINEVLD